MIKIVLYFILYVFFVTGCTKKGTVSHETEMTCLEEKHYTTVIMIPSGKVMIPFTQIHYYCDVYAPPECVTSVYDGKKWIETDRKPGECSVLSTQE